MPAPVYGWEKFTQKFVQKVFKQTSNIFRPTNNPFAGIGKE
jgi:hypothetical protein